MPDIELLHAEFERRKHQKYAIIVRGLISWIIVISLFYFGFIHELTNSTPNVDRGRFSHSPKFTTFISELGFIKDTLYTFMNSFLEINLDSQKVYQHWRDGKLESFKISTGTSRLNKGKETSEGVFVIQSKIDWLYSIQFDSAKVFNWLGFNYGIGFHSLEGKKYYGTLGKKASSHGCVRLSREDAQHLYRLIEIGTPVIVHHSNFARVISFISDSSNVDTSFYSETELRNFYRTKLKALYRGEKFFHPLPNIPLSAKSITHDGLDIGDTLRIPKKQRVPPFYNDFVSTFPEHTYKRMKTYYPFKETTEIFHNRDLENQIIPEHLYKTEK